MDPLKDHLRLVGKQSAVPGSLPVILDEETLKEHVVFSFDSFIFRLVSFERRDCKFSNQFFFFLFFLLSEYQKIILRILMSAR